MIANITNGSGFGGLTRYLFTGDRDQPNPARVAWTSTRNLAVDSPHEAAYIMRATAELGRTDQPVYHLSISIHPDESLTRAQWETVADNALFRLGLSDHQALIVAHNDKDHQHIHIVVNRVHPVTAKAWDRWQDVPRVQEVMRAQEQALGLRAVSQERNPDALPAGALKQFERTGEPPLIDYARATIRPAFAEARSWSELHDRLAEHGLVLERKGQGLVVTDDHQQVKASAVDRSASLRSLESRLGPYQEPPAQLAAVDRALREQRQAAETAHQLEALTQARARHALAVHAREDAVSRLAQARDSVARIAAEAFRDPSLAARRYLDHLDAGGSAAVNPQALGTPRGRALQIGGTRLSLGSEAEHAARAQAELPRAGTAYLNARAGLLGAERSLGLAHQQLAELDSRLAPLRPSPSPALQGHQLAERIIALRPADQLLLARAHGSQALKDAAERAPERLHTLLAAREWWVRNLGAPLVRALARQTSVAGDSPSPGVDPAAWMANAVRLGVHPAHATQALVRSSEQPLVHTAQVAARAVTMLRAAHHNPAAAAALQLTQPAGKILGQNGLSPVGGGLESASRTYLVTRGLLANPASSAARITAKALGVPALPVRLASLGWTLTKAAARAILA